MCEKGVYPYDYISSFDKLYDTELPNKALFYSKLNNSHISTNDYKQAKTVWKRFNCKTLLDYHNVYLKSDVLLLSDIWNNFREICYENYNLDCCYYYTAPGLSWSAMLKYTKIELELITDMDKYLFVGSSIRGGISQISTRYSKTNNSYMNEYNPNEQSKTNYLFRCK